MHLLSYQIIIRYMLIFVIGLLYHKASANIMTNKDNFLSADNITYDSTTKSVRAYGNVHIISQGYIITADNIIYDSINDELFANGNVRVKSDSNAPDHKKIQLDGDSIFFENKMKSGIIQNFILYFGDNSILASTMAKRIDENHSILKKSEYTACSICNNRYPLWSISSKETDLNFAKEKVIYKNVFFKVYGVPIFFTPYFAHPTPKAKAQSGILIPNKSKAGIGVPIYFRPKDNFDNTTTPRLSSNGLIIENETRYLSKEGEYNTNLSFIRSNIKKTLDNNQTKNQKQSRFYVSSKADLVKGNYNYGYDFNRTSDKAYLKEYYDKNDPHLTSNIYIEKINKSNFARIDALHFQELKASTEKDSNSYVFPEITVRQITPIIDDSTNIILENSTIHYSENNNYNVSRNNLTTILSKTYKTTDGHLISLSGYNRADFYYANIATAKKLEKNGIATRNIPEIHLGWQYPLIRHDKEKMIILEPEILFVEGFGTYKKNLKYDYIDVNAYDLNEVNLFNSNRYSGFDFHEYGRRLSYGIKARSDHKEGYTIKGFLGKLEYLTNSNGPHKNPDLLIKSSINFSNLVEIYYNTKIYSKTSSKFREEIGAWYNNNIIYSNISMINIIPSSYYTKDSLNQYSSGIKQMFIDTRYKINDEWSAGYDIRFDLASYKKISPISRNIKMTYHGDCVNISMRIGKTYTADPTRGIYKTDSNSVSLSLKTLSF